MSLEKLNIPKKILIGFNQRSDTYTKKLGYIVYRDAKGAIRKEKSWNTWKSKTIPSEEYDNEPTEGFVLNKKVGGDRGGWNPRATYVRVYDPRGFEFEISIPNLLFILEECSSIKGKGLEGKFVYAWDGTELVLLPVTSAEYVKSADFTKLQTQKVDKKDIIEGGLYQTKDNIEVMYLGRHDWSEYDGKRERSVTGNGHIYHYGLKTKKKHIFVDIKHKIYLKLDGFVKIGSIINSDCQENFAAEFDKLKEQKEYGANFSVICKEVNLSTLIKQKEAENEKRFSTGYYATLTPVQQQHYKDEFSFYFLDKETKKKICIHQSSRYNYGTSSYEAPTLSMRTEDNTYTFSDTTLSHSYSYRYSYSSGLKAISREELEKMVGLKLTVKNNSNGKTLHEVV